VKGDSLWTANFCRSGSPREFPGSGRSRQHAEVAVAVDARWRHQGGEVVEQFQRRQQQRAVSTRTGFVALIVQAFGIEFAPGTQATRIPLTTWNWRETAITVPPQRTQPDWREEAMRGTDR